MVTWKPKIHQRKRTDTWKCSSERTVCMDVQYWVSAVVCMKGVRVEGTPSIALHREAIWMRLSVSCELDGIDKQDFVWAWILECSWYGPSILRPVSILSEIDKGQCCARTRLMTIQRHDLWFKWLYHIRTDLGFFTVSLSESVLQSRWFEADISCTRRNLCYGIIILVHWKYRSLSGNGIFDRRFSASENQPQMVDFVRIRPTISSSSDINVH